MVRLPRQIAISVIHSLSSGGRLCIFSLFFFALSLSFFLPPSAVAHISEDSTPDPVAKMEYLILLDFQPNNIDVRNKLAMVFLRLNELPEAAGQFKEVLQREPTNFNAIDGMGLVFHKQKKYREALARFDEAVTINAKDAMVYYHRGLTLEALDRLKEAAENYEKALTLLPAPADSKLKKQKREVAEALQTLRTRLAASASR